MGIFGAILDKLRGHAHASQTQPSAQSGSGSTMGAGARTSGQSQGQAGSQEQVQARSQAGQQAGAQAGVQPASGGQMQGRTDAGQQAGAQSGTQTASAASSAALQNVDVETVLAQLAQQKGGGGNYRQSIVDLLKLLDLDSSLAARKELAEELGVRAGADGSAEQNIALHKAVMRKVAENGGKVPASLRD